MTQEEKVGHITLWSLFWTFFKIGCTAFGGFMALISVVQNYIVERRKLLSQEDMLDGVSLATILPGPVAVNVVAYVGYKLQGIPGAIVAASAVTLPSFFLVLGLSYVYFTWGEIPAVTLFFLGFIPAVAAIILATVWNMGRKTLTGISEAVIAALAFAVIVVVGGFYSTIAVIVIAGLVGLFLFRSVGGCEAKKAKQDNASGSNQDGDESTKGKTLYSSAVLPLASAVAPLMSLDFIMAGKLLVTFAGMSVLLFGGGFVFIPLMQESIVEQYGWLTHKEFIDGIAMGQVTPGPILISATFIGYKVAGLLGATAATIGIFTPPAILMVVSAHYLEKIKHSKKLKAALRGIRSAVTGMILAAAYVIATTAQPNLISLLILVLTLVALLRFKVEVAWIIPTAGTLGLLLY